MASQFAVLGGVACCAPPVFGGFGLGPVLASSSGVFLFFWGRFASSFLFFGGRFASFFFRGRFVRPPFFLLWGVSMVICTFQGLSACAVPFCGVSVRPVGRSFSVSYLFSGLASASSFVFRVGARGVCHVGGPLWGAPSMSAATLSGGIVVSFLVPSAKGLASWDRWGWPAGGVEPLLGLSLLPLFFEPPVGPLCPSVLGGFPVVSPALASKLFNR